MKKSIALFFFLCLMLFFPETASTGTKYGLLLWYNSVVPALFPFMVLSNLIVHAGGIENMMTPVYWLLHKWLPITENGCYVLLTGLLCGCPMGAKTCADFVKTNQISLEEGRFLLAVCNQPSPMFLLGYVLPLFSGSVTIAELLFAIYFPILLLALFSKWHSYTINRKTIGHSFLSNQKIKTQEETFNLDESIMQSVEVLCRIGGYLVFFSIMIVFLKNMLWIPSGIKLSLIAALEMTTAARELTAALNISAAFPAAAAALSFGGFSALFQIHSVLDEKKTGLSARSCFLWKLAHAALSAACAGFLCIIR